MSPVDFLYVLVKTSFIQNMKGKKYGATEHSKTRTRTDQN